MAKNRLANIVNTVAKESFESANTKKIIWVEDELILNHPLNEEDLTYTEDIEEHIRTEGFRYPLTVTKYGVPETDKYYIISGHRSRLAGKKLGKTKFPCIVEDFASETDVYHAILSGNTRRNYDPLDLAARYQKWDKYLDMIEFKGNRAEKIGKSLGISAKQAEKYKAFSKIIPEFWDLVRTQDAAKDGLYQLAPKSAEEQKAIYDFFFICNPDNDRFTVKFENEVINAFRLGARTYDEYIDFKKKRLKEKVDNYAKVVGNKEEEQTKEKVSPIERGCITGQNPYGNCVCCGNNGTVDCCAQCNENCNSRCGWINDKKTEKTVELDVKTEEKQEKTHYEKSVLSDFEDGKIKREISGHNDNKAANEQFKLEEKNKYKEERLTEEDKELIIANKKRELPEQLPQIDLDPENCKTDIEIRIELAQSLGKYQSKFKIDGSYEPEELKKHMMHTGELICQLMNELCTLRDDNMAYDEYNEVEDYIKENFLPEALPF